MTTFQATTEGVLYFNNEQIANFVPRLDHVFRDIAQGGTGPPATLQVSVIIEGQPRRQSADIDYMYLDSFKFENHFPGCICSDNKGRSTRKLVIRYIREQLGKMIVNGVSGVYYAIPGWYIQPEGLRYLAGKQIIGPRMEQPFLISPTVAELSLVSDSKLTPCESTEALARILWRFHNVTLPVFAFTLFASLRSVLSEEGLPTACVLYINGHQGYGKSETAKRFCALYQSTTNQFANTYDARSTEAAMRNALADARDQAVFFDDVCRSTNRKAQKNRLNLAADLVRAAANEIPITRMRGKNAEAIQCVASLVITSEFPLETASDLTRCVIVDIDQQLTGGNDSDRTVAASALAGYLQWFSEHSERELEQLRTDYLGFKTKERSHREEQLQISLWELSWVFGSFLRFAESVGAISHKAAEQFDVALTSALHQILKRTFQRIENLNTHTLTALASIIKTGALKNSFQCFQYKGCLCVRAEALTAYLRQFSGNFCLSVSDVTTRLKQQELLITDNTGKSTRKVRGVRVLTIPLHKLK